MDSKIVQVALNGLENILRFGEQESKTTGGPNPYAVIIEEVFGLDKIEFLQVRVIQHTALTRGFRLFVLGKPDISTI